jgi:hypothetical protein
MEKVGILSMQRIINYGSFLQAYGLMAMLKELGHDVEFVDYHIGEPLINETGKQRKGLKGKISKAWETLHCDAPLKHKVQFILYKKQFADKYHRILGLTVEPNYTPNLNTLIIGSDEVFNCIQKNACVGYSLELFGKYNKAKKLITYAASFGNTTFDKLKQYGKIEEIGKLLKKFNAISVRDINTALIVKQLSGKEAIYNFDPVLVYDFIGKCDLIPNIKPKEKYLILYAYSARISKDEAFWISSYAKKRGLKVYAIGGVHKCADKFINCSPFEVLAYFLHAEEVITDTFHGTIFSIITKRQFAAIVRKSVGNSYGNEEKLTDLLNRLELKERMTTAIDQIEKVIKSKIDYDIVDYIIF